MHSIIQKLQTVNKIHIALGVFAVFVLLFYGNTLQNGFVSDDVGQIEQNENIRSLTSLPKAFSSCIWESANRGCYGASYYYRPVQYAIAIFTYQFSD